MDVRIIFSVVRSVTRTTREGRVGLRRVILGCYGLRKMRQGLSVVNKSSALFGKGGVRGSTRHGRIAKVVKLPERVCSPPLQVSRKVKLQKSAVVSQSNKSLTLRPTVNACKRSAAMRLQCWATEAEPTTMPSVNMQHSKTLN